jgi:hypothetical protein
LVGQVLLGPGPFGGWWLVVNRWYVWISTLVPPRSPTWATR